MTAIWDKDAQAEKTESQEKTKQQEKTPRSDAVNKYTSKLMEGHEASLIFASPHSEWSGSADSAVHSVHSLLRSVEDTQTAMGVTNAWESHSWDGAPSPLSAQSVISQGDSKTLSDPTNGTPGMSGPYEMPSPDPTNGTPGVSGPIEMPSPDPTNGTPGMSGPYEMPSPDPTNGTPGVSGPIWSGPVDSGSSIPPGMSTDAIMQQAAQSDATLAQVLTDSQAQMSSSGFAQYAQDVYQNWNTGAFPDDTSLLEASAYQLQQQGGSAADVSAAQTVAQTDLTNLGDNAVSTYGSNGTNTIIQELTETDPTLGQVLTDAQSQMSAGGLAQFAEDVYQNWGTGAFPDDASLLQAASYQLQQQGGSASDVSAAQTVAQTDLTNLGDSAVSTYGAATGAPSGGSGGDGGTGTSSGGSGGDGGTGTSSGGSGGDGGTGTSSGGSGGDGGTGTSSGGSGGDGGTGTSSGGSGGDGGTGTSSGGSGGDGGTGTSSGGSGGDGGTGTSSGGSGGDGGTGTPASGSGPGAAIGPNGEAVGSTATTFGADAMPASAQSAPGYYVEAGASGDGTGTLGSQTNPFSTLQQAQQAMENSDIKTTYVEGGTYDVSSGLSLGSSDSGESFIGVGGSSNPVVLDGGGTSGSIININGANNISVEGMTLQNTQQNLWAYSSADAAVTANNSSGDNFSYNNISNVGVAFITGGVTDSQFNGNAINDVQQAIAMNPGSNNNTIDSNSITNVNDVTGGNQAGAINLDAATNTMISNNYIQNTAGSGIEMANWGGVSPNGNSVIGNTLLNTDSAATPSSTYDSSGTNPSDMGAIYAWQGVGNDSDNMNLTISNNYINGSGQGFENVGIYLDDGVSGASVTNNIVVPDGNNGYAALIHGGSNDTFSNNIFDLDSSSGDQHGILLQNDGPQMNNDSITNNIFYATGANGGAYVNYSIPTDNIPQNISNNDYYGVNQSNDSSPITSNPGFVDPSNGDYELEPGSPVASLFPTS